MDSAVSVAHGGDGDIHVGDALVGEAAHYVQQGIGAAYITEELVAAAFPLAGATHESGYVGDLDRSGDAVRRCEQGLQPAESSIGNLDDGDIRLDRAERIV